MARFTHTSSPRLLLITAALACLQACISPPQRKPLEVVRYTGTEVRLPAEVSVSLNAVPSQPERERSHITTGGGGVIVHQSHAVQPAFLFGPEDQLEFFLYLAQALDSMGIQGNVSETNATVVKVSFGTLRYTRDLPNHTLEAHLDISSPCLTAPLTSTHQAKTSDGLSFFRHMSINVWQSKHNAASKLLNQLVDAIMRSMRANPCLMQQNAP